MNTQATSPGCPDIETLSAYFDGEFTPDETVRAHFEACPDCAKRLSDYEFIRRTLAGALLSEPDPGMNARIAAFVRAENAKLPPVARPGRREAADSRTAWIFRIAALFLLAGFFIFLLTDRMQTNRELRGRTVAGTQNVQNAAPTHHVATPVLEAEPGAGDYVRARLVSNSPSSRQYAIDVDPMLLPGDFGEIPGDGRIPIPLASVPGADDVLQRIQLHGDAFADALMLLESIRRDLTALDVPGVTVDTESRGNSLFTTIRLDSDLRLDMNAMKTDGMFEFHLMSGTPGGNDAPVVFQIEFFCE